MLAGIDLDPDKQPGLRGHEAYLRLYEAGLMVKATSDVLLIAPPLIAQDSHISMITEHLKAVLSKI